jgi:phage gp45-like
MRNAFVRALVPKVDEKVTVQTVQEKVEEKKKIMDSPPPEKAGQKMGKPAG